MRAGIRHRGNCLGKRLHVVVRRVCRRIGTSACFVLCAVSFTEPVVCAEEVTIVADRDNTLYETSDGSRSNGAGILFFAGRSGPSSGFQLKRGLLRFDVAGALPAGAEVQSVVLNLKLFNSGPATVSSLTALHRVLGDWGEGTSNGLGSGGPSTAGDATWLHRFYPTVFWDTPGGDYAPLVSAATLVGDSGFFAWGSTPEMVADVQFWQDQPESNFGWAVVGDEGGQRTAKGFATHEIEDDPSLPRLTIVYTTAVPGDCDDDGDVDVLDYATFLECFTGVGGGQPGEQCGCVDMDDDGDVDLHDLGRLQMSFTGG
jgi:hypothetical protein